MQLLFLLVFVLLTGCYVEDAAGKKAAATYVYAMEIERGILENLQANEAIHVGVNYNGIKFEKDEVTLIAYLVRPGQATSPSVPMQPTGDHKKFFIKKRFGTYYITRQMVQNFLANVPPDQRNTFTHFVLEPVSAEEKNSSEYQNYVSYEIGIRGNKNAAPLAAAALGRLDPSPPARPLSIEQ